METTSLWLLSSSIWSRWGCAFLHLALWDSELPGLRTLEASMYSTGDPLGATAFRSYLLSWSLAPLVREWHYWIPTASGQ